SNREAPLVLVDEEVVQTERKGLDVLLMGSALVIVANAHGAGRGLVVPRDGGAAPRHPGGEAVVLLLFLFHLVGRSLLTGWLPRLLIGRLLHLGDLGAFLRTLLRLGVDALRRLLGLDRSQLGALAAHIERRELGAQLVGACRRGRTHHQNQRTETH